MIIPRPIIGCCCSSAQGSLEGSIEAQPTSVNLTTEGTIDWVHWGEPFSGSVNKKDTTNVLGERTKIGVFNFAAAPNSTLLTSWTDGTPTVSITDTANIAFAQQAEIGEGISITAPADTTERMLTVYLNSYSCELDITAELSDGSAADYTVTFGDTANVLTRRKVTIAYKAASAGQTLTFSAVVSAGSPGNIDLIAATLQ